MKKFFRFDTETFPIREGLLAPKMVCLQYANDIDGSAAMNGEAKVVLRADSGDVLHAALQDPTVLVEAFNGAFDQVVIANAFPDLLPWWFKALADGRGRDTSLREKLIEIRNGTLQDQKPKGWFSLAGIAERRLGRVPDKSEDTWRLRYALLDGVPVNQWPKEALSYGLDDVFFERDVSRHQLAEFEPKDEWLQVAAGFCLQLAASWGFRVDAQKWEWVATSLMTREEESARLLEEAGLFSDGSVKQNVVRAAVERACARAGKEVPKSKPSARFEYGQTKIDEETCETLRDYDASLKQLSVHNNAAKMLSTYLHPMSLGKRYACTSRPNTLVATGRTSWGGSSVLQSNPWWPTPPDDCTYEKVENRAGTNLQNFPREEGVRDLITPRPGNWWLSVDYDSLELRAFSQVLLWVCGSSVMASRYQADPAYDPHTELAAKLMGVTYEEGMRLKAQGSKELKAKRQLAKAANFGYPGGLGAKRFIDYAWNGYGVLVSVNEAYELKDAWMRTFPEVRQYFEWISYMAETGQPFKQFVSDRIRGGVGFSDGCNTGFQGLSADGAKRALFAVSMACYAVPTDALYGSRVIAFIHDENCLETPIETAHEAALSCVSHMEREMQIVLPDIPVRATPALSTAWIKAAEPRYQDGRLVAWDL